MASMASLMAYLFSIFNYQYFESYMISKLYKKVEKSEAHALKKDKSIGLDIAKSWRGEATVTDQFLDPNKVSSLKMLAHDSLICKCFTGCLKKNKSEELFEKGMQYYEKEIDIIELLRAFREIRIVLKEYIMREQQNFSIEKTSELGFLHSVAA